MTPGAFRRARVSRMRLVVLQVMVLSLFLTLFGRLWYLQVLAAEGYQARATAQSVRTLIVEPERGLIVDAQGRPLVANRTSWVIAVDRAVLDDMDEQARDRLLRRLSRTVDVSVPRLEAKLTNCGAPGSEPGVCWNGVPVQPVPVATDVDESVALSIMEQSEDFPAVVVQQQHVRAYPKPFGVNAAHLLGYLSPVTEDELEAARKRGDESIHASSLVGRAGLERQYDEWLRGEPGYKKVAVDARGRVLGQVGYEPPEPGNTLVTSIDARVQAVVERQLEKTIHRARQTIDPVTGKPYVAGAGAAIVMEVGTGRIIAMASYPTYDPEVWVGGITQKQLDRLYSDKKPLLNRATQGQFAPGSTWKPFITAGALTHGYDFDTRLMCSQSYSVGGQTFTNFAGGYGMIGFKKALEVSCNTFFYRIGHHFWLKSGGDAKDVNDPQPLVRTVKKFGFGEETGIDLPGEASGRIADREWLLQYWKARKDHYCALAKKPEKTSHYMHEFSQEFCKAGYAYTAGDAINFAIGQGDTLITPLQLARAYATFINGGILYEPQVAKAIVDPQGNVIKRFEPEKVREIDVPQRVLDFIDEALKGVTREGTMAWRMGGFPLDKVTVRSKTGSAEVYGKQTTSWVASYTNDYVVVMMVAQGGTGSGTSGPAVRNIWEALYGIQEDGDVVPANSAIPGTTPPDQLPTFAPDGSILPPGGSRS